jgi:LacI family transcriptional regulator
MKKQSYKVDIFAVSRAAGVSPATVSRSINHPDLVNPATRKKVEKAIRKTGYIRNRAAQVMHGRRSATLGLVVPTVNYSIFAELVQSFNDTVSENGFALLLATHDYDLKKEYELLRKLLEHRVDGVALIGLDHSDDSYNLLASQNVPVVSVWNHAIDSKISCIGSDNAEAGRLAADHLLKLGHKHIGLVFPPTGENDRARYRFEGAKSALLEAGVEVPEIWQAESFYSIADSKKACIKLLQQKEKPTALICGNDIIAHGAIAAAFEIGIRIPENISIIGIGDFAGSAEMVPALTTVRVPAKTIGEQAGRYLSDIISDRNPQQIERMKVNVELKIRGTTYEKH